MNRDAIGLGKMHLFTKTAEPYEAIQPRRVPQISVSKKSLFVFGVHFNRRISPCQFDALAVPRSLQDDWYLSQCRKHHQQPNSRQHAAVNHAKRRNEEAGNDEQQTNCKRNVEGTHNQGIYV